MRLIAQKRPAMPNTKSNAEVARDVALISVPKHDKSHETDYGPYCMDCEPQEEKLFGDMITAIESALSAAQSTIAKEVLAALGDAKIPLDKDDLEYRQTHNKGVDMATTVLRDLFSRLEISVD